MEQPLVKVAIMLQRFNLAKKKPCYTEGLLKGLSYFSTFYPGTMLISSSLSLVGTCISFANDDIHYLKQIDKFIQDLTTNLDSNDQQFKEIHERYKLWKTIALERVRIMTILKSLSIAFDTASIVCTLSNLDYDSCSTFRMYCDMLRLVCLRNTYDREREAYNYLMQEINSIN